MTSPHALRRSVWAETSAFRPEENKPKQTAKKFWEVRQKLRGERNRSGTNRTARTAGAKMATGPGSGTTNAEPWGSFDDNLIQVS